MNERPIIFSTEMVKAILEDRKSQTRRTVLLPSYAPWVKGKQPNDWVIKGLKVFDGNGIEEGVLRLNKWGAIGDLLWVRESHKVNRLDGNVYQITYSDSTTIDYYYKKLSLNLIKTLLSRKSLNTDSWVPGMFLPKELARVWLKIVDLSVERLNDISEEDSIAEGIKIIKPYPLVHRYKDYLVSDHSGSPLNSAVDSFETLWASINGQESWDANPWVWVIKFKVLSTNGKPENLKQLQYEQRD